MNGIKVAFYKDGEKVGTSPSIYKAVIATNVCTTTIRKLLREGGSTVDGWSFVKAQEDK